MLDDDMETGMQKLSAGQKKLIGKNIAKCRTQKRIDQETISAGIGMSLNYYSEIERGVKKPSIDSFILIANYLDVSADLLFGTVLKSGYKIISSELSKRIETLTNEQRDEILAIIELMEKRNNP